MTQVAVVTGAVGLAAAGFVAWQVRLRRRIESSVKRIPVRVDRRPRRAAPPTDR